VWVRAVLLAATLMLTPPSARGADLVIWWSEGRSPEEDAAVKEIVTAFEVKTDKNVELVFYEEQELPVKTLAAVEIEQNPPDFVFSQMDIARADQWAYEGRLVDLRDAIGLHAAEFERAALERGTLLDATTGQRSLYMLPMGRVMHHVHAWRSLLEQAGFTLADIPKDWEPFWSFWCDKVQPAVRKALGRDNIWGIGLPMSEVFDTANGFWQFVNAYEADYVTRDGRLVIDEPLVRNRLAKVLDSYTAIWRKGCTPPEAVDWDNGGNNKAFFAQTVVMTINQTLSIPNALKTTRPEDYYHNAVTIDWPNGAYGQPLIIYGAYNRAFVFRDGGHVAAATEFVRFLVDEGWLAHWLDFAGDRLLPPLPALLETPFWLDPSDPHRMRSAVQFLTLSHSQEYVVLSGDWRHGKVDHEFVWEKTIHRSVTEGITPEQGVDEAIARIKQILSE
jgi:multiple sugar transport system substrate-binding protein